MLSLLSAPFDPQRTAALPPCDGRAVATSRTMRCTNRRKPLCRPAFAANKTWHALYVTLAALAPRRHLTTRYDYTVHKADGSMRHIVRVDRSAGDTPCAAATRPQGHRQPRLIVQ